MFLIPGILAVVITACGRPDGVEEALWRAGENRRELEKVLDHFKGDDFKYLSACFLIANMTDKFGYAGWQIDSLKARKPLGRFSDEEMKSWSGFRYARDCRKIPDITCISAELLIENIDLACDTWLSRPWHARYSFEDFCEYVLPYRIDDEPLEPWRKEWLSRYSQTLDSVLMKTDDVAECAAAIASRLKGEGFDNHADVSQPHLGASFLVKHRVGFCRENCDIAIYAMRALGIPVATDFYITSPSYNSHHYWNAVIDIAGLALPFNYTESEPSRTQDPERRKFGKVYRYSFGVKAPKCDIPEGVAVPSVFQQPHVCDVSAEYFPDSTPVEVRGLPNDAAMAYLSVFTGRDLVPIDIAPVKDGAATFLNVEDGVILVPSIFEGGTMRSISFPVITSTGEGHRTLKPYSFKQESVVITRKYPMMNTQKFFSHAIGVRIDASRDGSFADTVPILEIGDTLQSNAVVIHCGLGGVRFIRYRSPADQKIEIGELRFFGKRGEIFAKEIKGVPELEEGRKSILSLINDDVWSSYYMSKGPGDVLIFDFGKPIEIDSLLFVPRTDDNFVRRGQDYELFYHSGPEGWKSLGRRRATADTLRYDNVPVNSLLWLHNHSGGKAERPFYIERSRQRFI